MIQISRPDVVSTHIASVPNPFIKLPIQKILKEIDDYEPGVSQIAIINALNRYRFVVAAISRRQGKTYIANIIGQCIALVPGCNILIISPNYQLSSISWDLQHKFLSKLEIKPDKDNAKDRVIELENGSTIRMGSINQVDSTVGRSYDFIIFDEAALTDGMDAFNVALRPTLDKPNSKAIFISTPRGKTNWFSVLWDRGFSNEFPEWCSIRADYHENPRITESDIAEARKSMSDAEFEQEYMANFNKYEGQIWNLAEECIVEELPPLETERQRLDIVAGLDLGFKDATAMIVLGYNTENTTYYVLDEYYAVETTTSKHASAIRRLVDRWDIDYIFIDSSAQQTRFDLARDYDIATINARKSVSDGIGYVSSLVDNKKIIVPKRCVEVLRAFDAYRWDSNVNLVKEKPIHDSASHMADAIRYALYSFESSTGEM